VASYSPTIIINTVPPVSVVSADSGSGIATPVTYNEIKQSMGTNVYDVKNIYMYSDNIQQLSGVVNYNRFDSNGDKEIFNITPIIDPFQRVSAINVDTEQLPIIFNGNSSISTTVLPNTSVKVQFNTLRTKNNVFNSPLLAMEIENTVEQQDEKIKEKLKEKPLLLEPTKIPEKSIKVFEKVEDKDVNKKDYLIIVLLALSAISIISYLVKKK
jgi:hypothetical protein